MRTITIPRVLSQAAQLQQACDEITVTGTARRGSRPALPRLEPSQASGHGPPARGRGRRHPRRPAAVSAHAPSGPGPRGQPASRPGWSGHRCHRSGRTRTTHPACSSRHRIAVASSGERRDQRSSSITRPGWRLGCGLASQNTNSCCRAGRLAVGPAPLAPASSNVWVIVAPSRAPRSAQARRCSGSDASAPPGLGGADAAVGDGEDGHHGAWTGGHRPPLLHAAVTAATAAESGSRLTMRRPGLFPMSGMSSSTGPPYLPSNKANMSSASRPLR